MTILSDVQKNSRVTHQIGKILLANVFVILLGMIKIPLPFSPIPLVLQVQGCLMLPLLIGGRNAFFSILCLVMEGIYGLPVMGSGKVGLALIMGPTAGYVMGYLVSPYLVEKISSLLKERTEKSAFIAMLSGNLAIYVLGAVWLSQFLGFKGAILFGVAPFIFSDLFKLMIAVKITHRFSI